MPVSKQEVAMRRSVDLKRLNLSDSDQTVIRKWSRAVAAFYASVAIAGVIAAVATSAPRLDNVTAQRTPPVVTFDQN
jgi:hypothetical protein